MNATNVIAHGFLFQLSVCRVAKAIGAIDPKQVTVPNIVDTIYSDIAGPERTNASQRVRMFMRMLEDNGLCERVEEQNETYYKIDFKKVTL